MSIFGPPVEETFDKLNSFIDQFESGFYDINYYFFGIDEIFKNVHSISSTSPDYCLPKLIDALKRLESISLKKENNDINAKNADLLDMTDTIRRVRTFHIRNLKNTINLIYKSDNINGPFNFFYYCFEKGSRFEFNSVLINRFKTDEKYNYLLGYISDENRRLNGYDYYLRWAQGVLDESKKIIENYLPKSYLSENEIKSKFRIFIVECNKSNLPIANGIRDKSIKMYLELAFRYNFKLGLEDINFSYILRYFESFKEIDSKSFSIPFEDFYYSKGNLPLSRELSIIFEEMKYYKNTFYNDITHVKNFVDIVLDEITKKTYSIIDIYLKTLTPKVHNEFKKNLANKINYLLENCNYNNTNYTSQFLSYLVSLSNHYTYNNFTKPSSSNLNTSLTTNEIEKEKREIIKVCSFKWTGTEEDLNKLFIMSNNKILKTNRITFYQIFSVDEIEPRNKIKWLLKVHGKKDGKPEIISIFHFLYKLQQRKLISIKYNFIHKNRNTRIESSNFYEQIANFFVLSNNAPINKHNLKNKKFTTTLSKNKILIDSILSSL